MNLTRSTPSTTVRIGIRPNLRQFSLLVIVNGLVGALVGQERTLVPMFGERIFGLSSAAAAVAFVASFGMAKAAANLAAGALADRVGRRRVLILGWVIGVPVPIGLMVAPSWQWIIALNVLLGINQGLTWSTTVIMKIDLAGPLRRGLAMGINEFAGYVAVAASAVGSGLLAEHFGLRPEPLLLGVAIVGLGLAATVFLVEDTAPHARLDRDDTPPLSVRAAVRLGSYEHRTLAAASRTGLINNANDAYVWALLPVLLLSEGLRAADIGLIAGVYPAVWGAAQLGTGALSDRLGRRGPAAIGMLVQAAALLWLLMGAGVGPRVAAAAILGLGTALTYPALLAAVADTASGASRASAVGVYRAWRDLGYVAGAIFSGVTASAFGLRGALLCVAALTAASGCDAWRHLRPVNGQVVA
ncbi:MAG TPA: MFS transporter [Actinomycetota bacterium]|nr:MFS transporter [Actinomycetota bacterium]